LHAPLLWSNTTCADTFHVLQSASLLTFKYFLTCLLIPILYPLRCCPWLLAYQEQCSMHLQEQILLKPSLSIDW